MNWFEICSNNYRDGYYNDAKLKVFVVRNKITAEDYKTITGTDYAV